MTGMCTVPEFFIALTDLVCSTIVSSITNLTLILDLVRTKDFAQSGMGTHFDSAFIL